MQCIDSVWTSNLPLVKFNTHYGREWDDENRLLFMQLRMIKKNATDNLLDPK